MSCTRQKMKDACELHMTRHLGRSLAGGLVDLGADLGGADLGVADFGGADSTQGVAWCLLGGTHCGPLVASELQAHTHSQATEELQMYEQLVVRQLPKHW